MNRDYAIDLLRDEGEDEVIATPATGAGAGSPGALNPFALGLPFKVLGVLLLPLFSIVGLALLVIGAFMCVVGVAMAITRRRPKARG